MTHDGNECMIQIIADARFISEGGYCGYVVTLGSVMSGKGSERIRCEKNQKHVMITNHPRPDEVDVFTPFHTYMTRLANLEPGPEATAPLFLTTKLNRFQLNKGLTHGSEYNIPIWVAGQAGLKEAERYNNFSSLSKYNESVSAQY